MSSTPLVSIIVPCYNQAHFLRAAVDSALEQTYSAVEVVVVNDGSTDDTSDVARAYGDKIVLVEQANSGLSAARNAGILASKGEFVMLLDSDDMLFPHCVNTRMRYMSDPKVGIVAGYYREIDKDGVVLPRVPEVRRISDLPHFFQAVKRNWGPPAGWLIRRRALELCGMFDPFLKSCEDWDLLIRITTKFELAYDSEISVYYRQLPNQMSRNHLTMMDAGSKVLIKNAAYSKNRLRYWWWSLFGRFQHGRRIIFNVLTSGSKGALLPLVLKRPSLLWIGFLSVFSYLGGKRPSS